MVGFSLPPGSQLLLHQVPPPASHLPCSFPQMTKPGSQAGSLHSHKEAGEIAPVLGQHNAYPAISDWLAWLSGQVEYSWHDLCRIYALLSQMEFCREYMLFWICFVLTFTQTLKILLRFVQTSAQKLEAGTSALYGKQWFKGSRILWEKKS